MQLKKAGRGCRKHARPIGGRLAAATAALLGGHAPAPVVAQEIGDWDIETAALFYGESDGRVKDFSVNALARSQLREDKYLNITLALDALTGASPNGAVPSNVVQTFTGPSGNGGYRTAPGDQPLDSSFQDTRFAASANWEQPLGRLTLLNVGAGLSDEYDYTHLGVNAKIAHDFNERNTTLSAGLAYAADSVNPVGGTPIGLSALLPSTRDRFGEREGGLANRLGNQSKNVSDFLLGVTQVINRHTLVQFNYSLSQSDGYLTDPYKILSVVDPTTGALVPGPAGSGLNLYLYEQRPDTREKKSVFGLLKRDLGGNVLDLSYRVMTDDWGIDSQTVDVHFRWNRSTGRYFEPHIRFYSQNAADFYHRVLFDGQPVPSFASADYRLGKFDAVTLGVKYGYPTASGEISARLEVYQQSGEADPSAQVGLLRNYDLYPDLTAVIAEVSYKFGR